MGLDLNKFLLERNIVSLNNYKSTIDDEIKQNYQAKIESARKHYFVALTEDDRIQKDNTAEGYTKGKSDILVKCPACEKDALLRRKIQRTQEMLQGVYITIKRDLILKDLSCYYCGLNITDYDQLKLEFKDKEKSLRDVRIAYDCPDYDCPDDDCPDYDCPDVDCPDVDCPDYDCPDVDCPDVDCPDVDCPDDDCPDDDCPY
ncbi:unnamed protein product [marine sediment metagenome]|uniref:Uncharacterized protein n=1 Tax=marine sediment metagenome TaxID=412755 RepID=X0X872_9ZZZZ